MVDMGEGGSGDGLHHRDGGNHRGDEGLLVDLGVALVGDGVGQSLHDGHGSHMVDGSHILNDRNHRGHMVDDGSHWSNRLDNRDHGGNRMDHRSNWSNGLDDGNHRSHMLHNRNHWSHGLDNGNSRHHMLHHWSDHSLVMELGEALVGGGHRSCHFGDDRSHGHMVLLNESRSSSSDGGQGTDGDLRKCQKYNNRLRISVFEILTKRNILVGFCGWVCGALKSTSDCC